MMMVLNEHCITGIREYHGSGDKELDAFVFCRIG